MPLRDLILSTVIEATGIAPSELTAETVITENAIGTERLNRLIALLTARLHLGYLDFAFLPRENVGELIRSMEDLIPVYLDPGSRPDTVKLDCSVFRWHPGAHAPTDAPEGLRAVFEDGPWKWDTQYRFAGKGMNPGHYFGLNVEAATAEMIYYAGKQSVPPDNVLLTLDVTLDDVLDLTRKDVIIRYFLECIDGGEQLNPAEIVAALIETGRGGNEITDYIGHRAHREGYRGIVFFGARAIRDMARWNLENARPDDEDLNNDYEVIRFLGRNRDYFNLVVFSGADLLRATSSFRCGGPKRRLWGRTEGLTIANPYFGWNEEDILALSKEHGSEYQQHRRRGFFKQKPSILME